MAQLLAAPSTRPCNLADFVANASSFPQPLYIDAMSEASTGPVAAEMRRRLEAALQPTVLTLTDDSEQHRGHGGYNPAGESHFSLVIESAAFIGKSRIERQRLVHAALGDLLDERVHALSIVAREPQS
jgi:BolA family transcriptional regulator, general stress-responsive regulator